MKTMFFSVCPQDLDHITRAYLWACEIIIEESNYNADDKTIVDIDTANCVRENCHCRKGLVRYERRKRLGLPPLDDRFWERWNRCFYRGIKE